MTVACVFLPQDGSFCVVMRTARLGQVTLYDAMKFGCIPVVIADNYVMPFEDVIEWTRLAGVNIVCQGRVHRACSRAVFYGTCTIRMEYKS